MKQVKGVRQVISFHFTNKFYRIAFGISKIKTMKLEPVKSKTAKLFYLFFGFLFLIIGIIGLLLPILPGWLFLVIVLQKLPLLLTNG